MASLKGQVTYALNALQAFGQSRRQALAKGTAAEKIFSVRTMQNYCELSVTFALWCRDQHGIRRLAQITPAMTTEFVTELRRKRRSPATINTYVCAIEKLDAGLHAVGWRRRTAEPLVPTLNRRHADVVADPYSDEDAEQLIVALAQLDPQYGQVARLQRISGLRVSEAVHVEGKAIAEDGSEINLSGPGTHAKGGRPRVAPILPQHRPAALALRVQGLAQADGHVFQHRQSLTAALKRAASALAIELGIEMGDGTHSLRKLYANELYGHMMEYDALPRDAARHVVTHALGHSRLEVLKAYLVDVEAPSQRRNP
jgi:integrase